MIRYVIGLPGNVPRLSIETPEPANLMANIREGEVSIEVAEFENGIIHEDGVSFVPTGIDLELEAAMIRSQRSALLAATDWTQADYAPLSHEQKLAWAAYRQELRDLPALQPNATRDTVVWPVEPS
jgi:hypothetical protein